MTSEEELFDKAVALEIKILEKLGRLEEAEEVRQRIYEPERVVDTILVSNLISDSPVKAVWLKLWSDGSVSWS